MIKPEIELIGMGFNNTGYPGAFTPTIEKIIKKTIQQPCLHLFSGRSKIGDVRIDIERPEATNNIDIKNFIETNNDYWEWVILDPPYNITRTDKKLNGYGITKSLSANVILRNKLLIWLQQHTNNILWLDICAPNPKGFFRKKLWLCLPGGYHTVRVLSWLQREGTKLD